MTLVLFALLLQTPDPDPRTLMAELLRTTKLPAVGAAKVTMADEEIWVAGVRDRETKIPVAAEDAWHLGSDTKAFTAALVYAVAEQKKVKLTSKVCELLDIQKPDETHKDVTVLDLLDMKGRVIPNPKRDWFGYQEIPGKSLTEKRQLVAQDVLSDPSALKPGAMEYSNAGYVLLGHIVERWLDAAYEDALQQRILGPLGLASAGFGPNAPAMPQPHIDGERVKGDWPDNAQVMAPAGELHMSLKDWGRWCREVMKSIRGEPSLLPSGYGKALRDSPNGYCHAWVKVDRKWSNGPVYAHSGSNTMNFCTAYLAPAEGIAYLAVTNDGGKDAPSACDKMIGFLIGGGRKG